MSGITTRSRTTQSGWFRFNLKTMLVLMVCVASILTAWRSYTDLNESQQLARRLRYEPEAAARSEAARKLSDSFEEDSETVLSALRSGMVDPDSLVRRASVEAVKVYFSRWTPYPRSLPEADHEATAIALLDATEDRDPGVRRAGFEAIGAVGRPFDWRVEAPRSFVLGLIRGTTAREPPIREAAVAALASPGWRIPETRAVLARAIKDPSPAVRITAAHGIQAGGYAEEPAIFLALLATLDDADATVRRSSWTGIGARSVAQTPPIEAIPILVSALRRPESRVFARIFLMRLGPAASPAIPALIAQVEAYRPGPGRNGVSDTAAVLVSTGPSARLAIPALVAAFRRSAEGLTDPPEGRMGIAAALGQIDPAHPEVRKAAIELAETLKKTDFRRKSTQSEFKSLGLIGRGLPEARSIAVAILDAAKASSPADRVELDRILAYYIWDDEFVMPEFERLRAAILARDGPTPFEPYSAWIDAEKRHGSGSAFEVISTESNAKPRSPFPSILPPPSSARSSAGASPPR